MCSSAEPQINIHSFQYSQEHHQKASWKCRVSDICLKMSRVAQDCQEKEWNLFTVVPFYKWYFISCKHNYMSLCLLREALLKFFSSVTVELSFKVFQRVWCYIIIIRCELLLEIIHTSFHMFFTALPGYMPSKIISQPACVCIHIQIYIYILTYH